MRQNVTTIARKHTTGPVPGNPWRIGLRLAALWLLFALQACSSLLPHAHTESTAFPSFEAARSSIEALVPMQSNLQNLKALGIDPASQSNVTILSYPDLLRRFVAGGAIRRSELDPGIAACLSARDACRGWEISISQIRKTRTGPFLADFTNFSRRTETTGWRFNALILLANDIVVYRSWGGQPRVNEVEVNRNPLGPLQDIGPSLLR